MIQNIISNKKDIKQELKKSYSLKHKIICLIKLSDIEKYNQLFEWLNILPVDFIIENNSEEKTNYNNIINIKKIKKSLLPWIDFILTDNDLDWLKELFNLGIIPILPSNNCIAKLLKEFDPVNSEWNCYFYQESNIWSMFYAIIRYLENYKFPYDNKLLIKNIINM